MQSLGEIVFVYFSFTKKMLYMDRNKREAFTLPNH